LAIDAIVQSCGGANGTGGGEWPDAAWPTRWSSARSGWRTAGQCRILRDLESFSQRLAGWVIRRDGMAIKQ